METGYRRAVVMIEVADLEVILNKGMGDEGYIARPAHGLRDIKILRVTTDPSIVPRGEAQLIIESPDLEPVPKGSLLPHISLLFEKVKITEKEYIT